MVDIAQSTLNPADVDTLAGAVRQVLDKYLQNNIDNMLPARVIAYDVATNTARVQPLIMLLASNDNTMSRSQLTVPVFNVGGGGAVLRFNLSEGDLGWIQSNDRDISLFLASLDESRPNTLRKHQFDDAVFYPDKMRQFTPSDDDSGALTVLQNTDGTTRVSLFDNSVEITASSLVINGDVTVNGAVNTTGDVVAGSISLMNHAHSYIDSVGIAATPTPRNTESPS